MSYHNVRRSVKEKRLLCHHRNDWEVTIGDPQTEGNERAATGPQHAAITPIRLTHARSSNFTQSSLTLPLLVTSISDFTNFRWKICVSRTFYIFTCTVFIYQIHISCIHTFTIHLISQALIRALWDFTWSCPHENFHSQITNCELEQRDKRHYRREIRWIAVILNYANI